jgi:hypothetical protein
MDEARRLLLESLLEAEELTADDLSWLRSRLREPSGPDVELRAHVAQMATAAVDAELDQFLVCDVIRALLRDDPTNGIDPEDWPSSREALETEFERRVAARVRLLADVDEREREIRERAEALAELIYADRSFLLAASDGAQGDEPSGRPIGPNSPAEGVGGAGTPSADTPPDVAWRMLNAPKADPQSAIRWRPRRRGGL